MPFQTRSVTAPVLRRLSKALQKAHQDVVGSPIPLHQAQEIVARTLGHAHWHEAIIVGTNLTEIQTKQNSMEKVESSPTGRPLKLSAYDRDQYARLVYAAGLDDTALLHRLGEAALAQGEEIWGQGLHALAQQSPEARRQALIQQVGTSENSEFLMQVEPAMTKEDRRPPRGAGHRPDIDSALFTWATVGANPAWWTAADPKTDAGRRFHDRWIIPMAQTLAQCAPRLGVLFRAALHQPHLDGESPVTPCPDAWRTYALNTVRANLPTHVRQAR